jgi:hypothetical protein
MKFVFNIFGKFAKFKHMYFLYFGEKFLVFMPLPELGVFVRDLKIFT